MMNKIMKQKYQIGDKVWVMDSNKPVERTVARITAEFGMKKDGGRLETDTNEIIGFKYGYVSWVDSYGKVNFTNVEDQNTFSSKEELLKSL